MKLFIFRCDEEYSEGTAVIAASHETEAWRLLWTAARKEGELGIATEPGPRDYGAQYDRLKAERWPEVEAVMRLIRAHSQWEDVEPFDEEVREFGRFLLGWKIQTVLDVIPATAGAISYGYYNA